MVKTKKKTSRTKKVSSTPWPKYDIRFDPEEMQKKLRIDKYALDDEVEQQAELFNEVADAAAITKSQVDSLEQEIKELEAEIDAKTRADAEKYDERITENAIRAKVVGDKRRKALVVKLLQASDLQRRLEVLTTAYRQRSYMLRDMVDLHLSNYYTSRSTTGARENRRDDEVDRVTSKMSDRRKSRVKRHRSRDHGS